MTRTPNRSTAANAKAARSAARDDELRSILNETDDTPADDGDFPVEIGQSIEDERPARAHNGRIFGLRAGERAFVSVILLLIVIVLGVALLAITGRIAV